jgi:arylsulfatase A-like enzyme
VGAATEPDPRLASNLDVAPTILAAAGIPDATLPGHDLRAPAIPGAAVALAWAGDADVPAWEAIRSLDAIEIRWITGEVERYDLAADPDQLVNLAATGPHAPRARHGARVSPG